MASFCSKLSDTVSSEVGKAYGKTTYLVTTFQRVPRGTEGAVSLEGTAAGVAAAVLFSGVALAIGQVRGARSVIAPRSLLHIVCARMLSVMNHLPLSLTV